MENIRQPPFNEQLEKTVLGLILLDSDQGYDVDAIAKLPLEAFYMPQHQEIYKAIRKNSRKGINSDIATVTASLQKKGMLDYVGGPYYVTTLTNDVYTLKSFETYCGELLILHQKRLMIPLLEKQLNTLYSGKGEIDDICSEVISSTEDIMSLDIKDEVKSLSDVLNSMGSNEVVVNKVLSHYNTDNDVLGGYYDGDMIILAARPGMGKTAKALADAIGMAKAGNPTAFISLEMPDIQLAIRILSIETGIDAELIKKGKLSGIQKKQIEEAKVKLSKVPLFIYDESNLNANNLKSLVKKLVTIHKVKAVFIDYLQLMDDLKTNHTESVSLNSRTIKVTAKANKIPIIALSQLSREVEKRGGDKRPQLSDLRDSGAIEQDADVIQFLYRPEYYGITEDANGNSTKGIGEIIYAKNRSGSIQTKQMYFEAKTAQWMDPDGIKKDDGITDLFNGKEEDDEKPF